MDIKYKLISEVFVRPAIWDKRNENHHNNIVLRKLWIEVARECQLQEKVVKGQWKKLRETFSRKLAELTKRPGYLGGTEISHWEYFQSLIFLKNQFETKQLEVNLTDGANSNDVSEPKCVVKEENFILDDEPSVPDDISNETFSFSSEYASDSAKLNSKKRKVPIEEQLLEADQEKVTYSKKKSEFITNNEIIDEDISFFNSILPHVRELSKRNKLKFRRKILEVLEEFCDEELALPQPISAVNFSASAINTTSSSAAAFQT